MKGLLKTVCGLALGCSLVASGARASEPVGAQLDRALAQFEAGQAEASLATLEAAEKGATGVDAVRIQFYKARCFIELNRPLEARAALERYIAGSTNAKDQERGRRWMAKVERRFFGAIRVECTDGSKKLTLELRGGAKAQGCPAQWDGISPGRYTLTDGEKTWAVEVAAGKQVTLDLERDTQKVGALPPEPVPMRFGWGGFARAGGSLGEGTIDATAEPQIGAAIGAGAFADFIWQLSALELGARIELGYRAWRFALTGEGKESKVDTHGLMLPVLGVVGGPLGLSAELGGAAEYLLSGPDGIDTRLAIHAIAGLAWDLPLDWGRPRITVRYLREVVEGLDPNLDLRRHSVTAGLAFGL